MQVTLFQYLYVGLLVLCAVSVVLWTGMTGVAPFGVRVAYTDGGAMVISRATALPFEGFEGVFHTDATASGAQVTLARIDGAMRKDGALVYYTSESNGVIRDVYPAKAFQGNALLSLPIAGYLVAVLTHPVGLMACIGTPLVMLLVNALQEVLAHTRLRRIFSGKATEQFSI